MGEPTVTAATIAYAQGLLDLGFLDGSARAALQLSDGTTATFSWYHDEISYSPADFHGRTVAEIRQLHYERDRAYLRA